jgi:PAS domain S-box-containing protein
MQALRAENAELRARLEEAEETLRAIRSGEVDALVVGEQIYMLESADAASNRFRGEVLAQVNDVVIAVDGDNRVTYLNPAAERQYGCDASSVLGCGLDEVLHYRWLHPDDKAAAQRALRDTGVWRGGNIHIKRNGEEIHVESTVSVLRDGGGAAVGLLAVIRDIGERKQAEEALRASKMQLQALVETAPLGIYLIDDDFRLRQINPTALPIFGDIPDLVGRDFDEVIHVLWSQEYADELVKLFRHTLETGEPHIVPERIEKRRDLGVTEYYEWQINRVPLPDGRSGAVCYFRDISASVFARQTIAESEERLRLTMESVTDYAIMTMDTEGRIATWNVGAERTFGYAEEELVGQNHEILFTPEDREQGVPADEMRRAREAGRAEDERWHISKRGVRFYVSGVMAPLCANGVLTGYAKIARDLTERKEWEDALRRAHDELEGRVRERTLELAEANVSLHAEVRERRAAEERIRSLLRQIVTTQEEERRRIARELHDTLGQQLAALRLSIDVLKLRADNRVGLREEAERMQSIFDRLNSDIDFLAWELRPAALDQLGLDAALQNFVREWSEHFSISAEYRGYGLDGARLPPEVETNLYRILQEALQNVHKHAGADHVSVLLERQDGQAVLIVEDNGKGYDPEDEVASGSNKGMGVVNMRERTALVGGSLEIESVPGAGATIFVRVPFDGHVEGGEAV